MKYLNRTRKDITLPSGAQIEIRKLNVYNAPFLTKSDGTGGALALFILTNKVGAFRFEGETYTIVNKPPGQCANSELAIEDMEQADAEMIVDQVIEFSELTKAGQEARKTFREKEQGSGLERAQAGNDIPGTPSNATADAGRGRVESTSGNPEDRS